MNRTCYSINSGYIQSTLTVRLNKIEKIGLSLLETLRSSHCDLKVSRSQAKIYESFANYFLKTKANNKCFILVKCTCKELQKSISELER